MAVDKLVDSTKLNACLDAEANAIRAKTGGASDIPFDFANNKGFADAIAAIPSGGGSSGLQIKTGQFTLASDYSYTLNNVNGSYSGSILVATGLAKIKYVYIYSQEWWDDTETAVCFGACFFGDSNPVVFSNDAQTASIFGAALGVMRHATSKFYGTVRQSIVPHTSTNGVPDGSFGLRCHPGYPIKAGHTLKWEAVGTE